MRAIVIVLAGLWPALALAEGRGVLVVNPSSDTIRQIQISAAGSGSAGANRLRSRLPPGAQARIGYSSGCKVDVRLGFESGRSEEFPGQDACTESRIVAGQGAAGPSSSSTPASADAPARKTGSAHAHRGKDAGHPALAAKVVVPPWTGHSITKKFGGLN